MPYVLETMDCVCHVLEVVFYVGYLRPRRTCGRRCRCGDEYAGGRGG